MLNRAVRHKKKGEVIACAGRSYHYEDQYDVGDLFRLEMRIRELIALFHRATSMDFVWEVSDEINDLFSAYQDACETRGACKLLDLLKEEVDIKDR